MAAYSQGSRSRSTPTSAPEWAPSRSQGAGDPVGLASSRRTSSFRRATPPRSCPRSLRACARKRSTTVGPRRRPFTARNPRCGRPRPRVKPVLAEKGVRQALKPEANAAGADGRAVVMADVEAIGEEVVGVLNEPTATVRRSSSGILSSYFDSARTCRAILVPLSGGAKNGSFPTVQYAERPSSSSSARMSSIIRSRLARTKSRRPRNTVSRIVKSHSRSSPRAYRDSKPERLTSARHHRIGAGGQADGQRTDGRCGNTS